jgi:flavin-dependent dehydrogenase
METGYDVVVVGAGPSGAAASAILADNEIKTLLVEKESLPRHKICGGGISKKRLTSWRI